jgi:hypothetical protein
MFFFQNTPTNRANQSGLQAIYRYLSHGYRFALRNPVKTVTMILAVFSTVPNASGRRPVLAGLNQCPLAPQDVFYGSHTAVCYPYEEFLPNYFLITNTVFLKDAKIFHFAETHSEEHSYTNAKIISLLSKPGDLVLFEGINRFEELTCSAIYYYNYYGKIRIGIDASRNESQKYFFEQDTHLKCKGWEDMPSFNKNKAFGEMLDVSTQLATIKKAQNKLLENADSAFEKFAEYVLATNWTLDNLDICLAKLNAINETMIDLAKELSPESIDLINKEMEKAFINFAQSLNNSIRFKSAYGSVSSLSYRVKANAKKKTDKVDKDLGKSVKDLGEYMKTKTFIQNAVIDRNEKGLIQALSSARIDNNQINLLPRSGTSHVVPESAVNGVIPVEEILTTDPQYSLRKYFATQPYALFIPKDAIERHPAALEKEGKNRASTFK